MSDRILQLRDAIASKLPQLFDEARDQINDSINALMEDAQERDDGKAVLSLSITAKWDCDGGTVVVSMPVNVRRKYEARTKRGPCINPSLGLECPSCRLIARHEVVECRGLQDGSKIRSAGNASAGPGSRRLSLSLYES